MNKRNTYNNAFNLLLGSLLLIILGCSRAQEFKKDCNLCNQINQKEVETSMIQFVYNDTSINISKEAESQLLKEKETLRHGHKFIECGCKDNKLIYRLWCANNETFELEVKIVGNKKFTITGIQAVEFSHP
jgi:hypothetical protein